MNKSKKLRKCEQYQCAFMRMGTGCRVCAECNSEPYIVHDNCIRCWNCEHDAGILRWDKDDEKKIDEKQLKKQIQNQIQKQIQIIKMQK